MQRTPHSPAIARQMISGLAPARIACRKDWRIHGDHQRFRSIWISDIHLGSKRCKADELVEFLRSTRSEHLYLVGDVIDEWSLNRTHYWPASHADVLSEVLAIEQAGTRVTYVSGNHDEGLRIHHQRALGHLSCCDEIVHETADGRQLLVLHGDQFDDFAAGDTWVATVGSLADGAARRMNDGVNRVLNTLGLRRRSISLHLKQMVKRTIRYVADFERSIAYEARARGMDGVVCGHVHKAEMRTIAGVLYANDGDWVESCTALVEHADGALELFQWRDGDLAPLDPRGRRAEPAQPPRRASVA